MSHLHLCAYHAAQESSYIRSLPQPEDLSHLPAFWPPLDRAYLTGTDLEAEVTERLVQYELGWSLILEADPAFCERVSLGEGTPNALLLLLYQATHSWFKAGLQALWQPSPMHLTPHPPE